VHEINVLQNYQKSTELYQPVKKYIVLAIKKPFPHFSPLSEIAPLSALFGIVNKEGEL
jgi:hypothetical protein